MKRIESPQNATIKRLASLRQHRRRRAAGRVLVDGIRETHRAMIAGWKMLGFYEVVDEDGRSLAKVPEHHAGQWAAICRHASEAGVHIGVSAAAMRKLSYGEASQGALAEFEAQPRTLADLSANFNGLCLVLDRVEKPGNLGAVFRTADAAGVAAVLLADCLCDAMNPNAIRSSLGAVFTVPYAVGHATEIDQWLRRHAIRCLAMRVEGSGTLYAENLTDRVAVILGSEADGLADRWSTTPAVSLPMLGHVDSLNVSVSAAVVAYEAVRQAIAEAPPATPNSVNQRPSSF